MELYKSERLNNDITLSIRQIIAELVLSGVASQNELELMLVPDGVRLSNNDIIKTLIRDVYKVPLRERYKFIQSAASNGGLDYPITRSMASGYFRNDDKENKFTRVSNKELVSIIRGAKANDSVD